MQPSYYDLSWRLDVEVGRRGVRGVSGGVYMIRVDMLSGGSNDGLGGDDDGDGDIGGSNNRTDNDCNEKNIVTMTSKHLQCDYPNMKRVEAELKRALDSLKSVNSQNVVEYIT